MLLTSNDMILPLKYSSSRAASILGSQSGWVCPTCLVPHDLLWDLSDVIYPLRTRDGTLRLIEEAEGCSTKQEPIKSFWLSQLGTFQYFYMLARVLDI